MTASPEPGGGSGAQDGPPTAGEADGVPHGPLTELARRLRGLGTPPTARELAEALWLSAHVTPTLPKTAGATATEAPAPESPAAPAPSPVEEQPAHPRPHDHAPHGHGARLYAEEGRPPDTPGAADGTPGTDDYIPVRVPAATTLPRPLTLQRALRQLRDYRPPAPVVARRLDEQATAEHAAQTGLLIPVWRADVRREARLRLLMDVSTSTAVWDETLHELRRVCEGAGAFHEVQTHYLLEGGDGRLLVAPSPDPRRAAHRAEQLRDPTGRQLTLVLSDCAGPLWRDGRIQRLLHSWAQAGPVALVQPLPQRLWDQTHLPGLPGLLRRGDGLGGRLRFALRDGGEPPPGALPVPVLGLTPSGLGFWTRLMSGGTGLSLPGAAGWVLPDHLPAPYDDQVTGREPPTPADRIRDFQQTASPAALQLAVTLSAAPLTLPVMRLVQRATAPRSGPSVLAEVVLSGLLERGSRENWYAFLPGVREALLHSLPRNAAQHVLQLCGEYVERRYGRGAPNFPAWALARTDLTDMDSESAAEPGAVDDPRVPQPFAEVSRLVAERYGVRSRPRETAPELAGEQGSAPLTVVHGDRDYTWARWIQRCLAAHGYRALFQLWKPKPSVSLRDALQAVRPDDGGRLLLVLSEHLFRAAARDESEWNRALDEFETDHPGVLVPIEVDERPAPWISPSLAPAGLSLPDEGAALGLLFDRLGLEPSGRPAPIRARFPGTPPDGWAQVPRRADVFVGREAELAAVASRLAPTRPGIRVCALVGPPGAGKTATAVEYVHRNRDAYHAVVWLGRDRERGPDDALDRARRFTAEAARLSGREGHGRCLFVLDDWDTATPSLDLRAPVADAHVLFTATSDETFNRPDVVRVGPLSAEGAVEYLVRRGLADSRDTARRMAEEAEGTLPGRLERWARGRAPSAPESSRERRIQELAFAAVVRLYGADAGEAGGTFTGVGFFVAPGWVVTTAAVVRTLSHVVVRDWDLRTWNGEVLRAGGAMPAPDEQDQDHGLVLVQVPDARDHACVWLEAAPVTAAERVIVFGANTASLRWTGVTRVLARYGPDEIWLGPELDLPAGSAGSPVIDPETAVVLGALARRRNRDGGEAVLTTELAKYGALWQRVLHAHDRYHAAQLGDLGTWADVPGDEEPGGFTPALRIRLYGLFAELEPPRGPEDVEELLRRVTHTADPWSRFTRPCFWRDGVAVLRSQHTGPSQLGAVVLYAAEVCGALHGRSAPGRHALDALRTWVQETAATSVDPFTRAQVSTVLAPLERAAAPVARRSPVQTLLIELDRDYGVLGEDGGPVYYWRMTATGTGLRGRRTLATGEAGPPRSSRELREEIREALSFHLRNRSSDERPMVQFALPEELLDEPVDQWDVGGSPRQSALGVLCPVVIRTMERTSGHEPARRRWAAVQAGPLEPVLWEAGEAAFSEPSQNAVPVLVSPDSSALAALLDAGFPVALWRRRGSADDEQDFTANATALVRTAGSADHLPDLVHRLRREAAAGHYAQWAENLVLIYDDPLVPRTFR